MKKRKIIEIDREKCNGCGACIPDCPEGALQVIDGKARLISDLFCDGLGACIKSCPMDAMQVIEREAAPYDEKKVMERIIQQGPNVIKAHLEHLKGHRASAYLKTAVEVLNEKGIVTGVPSLSSQAPKGIANPLENIAEKTMPCGCPGSRAVDMRSRKTSPYSPGLKQESELRQWPVQLMLVSPSAPYFADSDLVVASDCAPFAYANFHSDFLKGKAVVIGCPKLDDIDFYKEKLTDILKYNNIKSVTVAHMEVPCCFGLYSAVESAIRDSGKKIPLSAKVISIQGEIKSG
ncbi:MAG: 4Fe-4S binding protein [Nanoarchaeota archaeon]|nr:4Fe-4S binding protein [Nanoarchaeota archaeon]